MAGRFLLNLVLLSSVLGSPRGAAAAPPTLRQVADSLATPDTVVVVASARSGEELFSGGFAEDPMPPGSVFKLVVALAAGYERPQALERPRYCPPKPSPQDAAPDGHGWIPLEDALAHSCNRYFAQLGSELGAARLWRTAARLAPGFTKVRPPSIPAAELALGTGVRMTAHQQVALLRTVATDWISAGQEAPPAATLRRIREGLCRSVSEGTARAVAPSHLPSRPPGRDFDDASRQLSGRGSDDSSRRLSGRGSDDASRRLSGRGSDDLANFTICGKTGTSLLAGSTVGWFGGYAPAAEPEVIIVVGLRRKLGRDAARAARGLFQAYFAHR